MLIYDQYIRRESCNNAITNHNFFEGIMKQDGTVIFEGAQGVLLDSQYGFYPHNTWSKTTSANALTLLEQAAYSGKVTTLGLLRTYATRHGAGPFVTEDSSLFPYFPEPHNETNDWQSSFRVGWLDLVALRYAIEADGHIDGLAISHVDRIARLKDIKFCDEGYRYNGPPIDLTESFSIGDDGMINAIRMHHTQDNQRQERLTNLLFHCAPYLEELRLGGSGNPIQDTKEYLQRIAEVLQKPISIISTGPTAIDKKTICTL